MANKSSVRPVSQFGKKALEPIFLQLALGPFAAECEAAGLRISTSKSVAMVLSWERVECPPWVREDVLPQEEEFKHLGGKGRMEREADKRIRVVATVMWTLHRSVVVKRELNHEVKHSIYCSIYIPTLNNAHEVWVVTERTRSQIQVAEMRFLARVAGLNLSHRVRSSDIQERLKVEPWLLHIERNQLKELGHLVWMPPGHVRVGQDG